MMGATVISIVHMNRRLRRWKSRRHRFVRPPHPTLGALVPSTSEDDWHQFDADLSQLETSVQVLRQRFEQIRQWQAEQHDLEQRLQLPGLSPAEITQLQQRLDDLEMQLESSVFDWRSLREPFWQAVRFGGIGIILGWILRSLALR